MVFKSIIGATYVCLALVSFNVNAIPLDANILDDGDESVILTEDITGLRVISNLLANTFNPDGGPTSVLSTSNAELVRIRDGNSILIEGVNFTIATSMASGTVGLFSIFDPEGDQTTITVNDNGNLLYEGGGTFDNLFAGESYFINFDYVVTDTIDTVISSFSLEIQGLGAPTIDVPEPSIVILMASGLIAFGVVRRKSRA